MREGLCGGGGEALRLLNSLRFGNYQNDFFYLNNRVLYSLYEKFVIMV